VNTDLPARRLPSPAPVRSNATDILSTAVNGWLALQGSARSARTYAAALARVNTVVPYAELLSIDRQQARTVADALAQRYAAGTVHLTISAMSGLWNYLIDEMGMRLTNPWVRLKLPRARDTLPQRLLTQEEVAAVIDAAAPGRNRTFVRFLYGTGLRLEEAMAAEWSNFTWDDHGNCWLNVYGKRARTRNVPIPDDVMVDLLELWGDRPLEGRLWDFAYRTGEHILERCRDAVGKAVSPHWMRHARATHAFRNGAPLHLVQQTMGHASPTTTMRYVHAMPGESDVEYLPRM
jgi:integrase/recombinase XerD